MSTAKKHSTEDTNDEDIVTRFASTYPEKYKTLLSIQRRFNNAGFEIFLVGGAVRNLVLGKAISDLDLASSAHPQDVMRLYNSVIPTGIKHGTVTLVLDKEHYEITTFRVDGEYSDARRPNKVHFTADIFEDLKRRDFTINAMALDLQSKRFLDPHGGRADLGAKIVRTVGDPMERFFEDGLRIVRGIRFASQLGFEIVAETRAAMTKRLDRLAKVSVERFRDEFSKTVSSPGLFEGLSALHELGIDKIFLPELAQLADSDPVRFNRALKTAQSMSTAPDELRWAAILLAIPGENARVMMLDRLKLPTVFVKRSLSLALLSESPYTQAWSDKDLRIFASRRGTDLVEAQMNLMSAWHDALNSKLYADMKNRMTALLSSNPPLTLRDLAVDGAALKKMAGIEAGPVMGKILEKLLDMVLENPGKNTETTLIESARKLKSAIEKP